MSNSFDFKPLCGSLFDNGSAYVGFWSESGGSPTHKVAMQPQEDGSIVLAFNKAGTKNWTKVTLVKAVDDPAELAARAHKGHVVFKGHKLHLWCNYKQGHEGDLEHARYDLKARIPTPLPV
jgi:hypothetical protein